VTVLQFVHEPEVSVVAQRGIGRYFQSRLLLPTNNFAVIAIEIPAVLELVRIFFFFQLLHFMIIFLCMNECHLRQS
jgi:hypothetical protein